MKVVDCSKLLPALFNDKDLVGIDSAEAFFVFFDGEFASNGACTTFVGFLYGKYEVRLQTVANRIVVEFTHDMVSKDLMERVVAFFTITPHDIVCKAWKEGTSRAVFQYYYKKF